MNANLALPEIEITLDKPRKFRLDFFALCKLEQKIGKSALRAIDWNDLGMNDTLLLLWAGLLSDDSTLTYEKVGELMAIPGAIKQFVDIRNKVMTGIAASVPPAESDDDAKKKAIAAQTTTKG
jgi:hypothetical protein